MIGDILPTLIGGGILIAGITLVNVCIILYTDRQDIKERIERFKYQNTKVSCGCEGAEVRRIYTLGGSGRYSQQVMSHCGKPGCTRAPIETSGKTKDKLRWR